MSKRTSKPFVPKQSVVFKKPRLDISIVPSQSTRTDISVENDNRQFSVRTASRTTNQEKFKPCISTTTSIRVEPPPQKQEIENMWDDDGDEFIVLASQAVEAELLSQKIINASHLEVTYNAFSTTNVKSSTQHPKLKKLNIDTEDLFADLENLDQDMSYAGNQKQTTPIADKILASWNTEPFTEDFKGVSPKKQAPPINLNKIEINQPSTSRKYNNSNPKLLSSLETLRKDNDKLKAECTEQCEKLQTREGEVATLRYEIKQLKLQNDTLRLEKINDNDNRKKEWLEKNKELERIIKSQKSELEFKNVAILNLKSTKKFNETQSMLNATANETHFLVNDLKMENAQLKSLILNNLNGLSSIDVVDHQKRPIKVNIKFFYNPANSVDLIVLRSQEEIELLNYLNYFQLLISKLKILEETYQIDDNCPLIKLPEIEEIILKVFKYFMNYINNLKFIKFTDNLQISNNPKFEYNFLIENYKKFKLQKEKMNIYDSEPFLDEKELIFRRILSGISILCKFSQGFSYNFFKSSSIRKNVYEILEKISYSSDLYDHIGIVTATSYILNNLITHLEGNEQLYEEFTADLIKLFRLLVFCRPNVDCLIKLSSTLVKVKSTNFLALLCNRGQSSTFIVNNSLKILQFSADSCILQVYAALLDVAIPQFEILNNYQINALIKLTVNTLIFFRYSLQCNLHWAKYLEKQKTSCNCYNRLSVATVTLLHLCLKHWIDNPKLIENRIISFIVKSGLLLLNEIFFLSYCKDIMLIGGFAINQRLQLIYDWILEYKIFFSFKTAHEKALNSMDMRYVISDPIKFDDEVKKPSKNLEIWNDIINNFFDLEIK